MARWMPFVVVALLLVAGAVLTSCSDDDDGDDDDAPGATAATTTTASGTAAAGSTATSSSARVAATPAPSASPARLPASGTSGGTVDDSEGVAFQEIDTGRAIVYVGTLLVEVEDVRRATQQAQVAIAGLGGLVFSQDTTSDPRPRTELTFKVMPEDFTEAMSRLEALGELKSQQISADDVTDRVVDLESRIITARASVERLRTFLEDAVALKDVAELESQLLIRETDLERLRGQLRTVQGQVALATIFLTLVEPVPEVLEARVEFVETAYAGDDGGKRCPADDLAVEEGVPVTVCVEVENIGDVPLVEIEIRDSGLGLKDDDFVALEGSVAGPLQPGERLLGYFLTEARLESAPSWGFSAVAVDAEGEPLRIPVAIDYDIFEYEVIADDSLPTFADGLRGSWGAVVTLARLGVLAVGIAIPFLWVVPLAFGLVWLVRRVNVRRWSPWN
ncbi:MAG: DUF4349 domain-containing protein [Chloroflexi bacterium]|nr:DUF4349 domain-containing protein [Chloroflexota bacterium]